MIRPATSDDIPALQSLWREFGAEIPDLPYRDDDQEEELQEIADLVGKEIVLVAEEDGSAVGLALGLRTGTKVFELRDLFVQKAARRSGVAGELMREFVAQAAAAGAEMIELDVLASNTDALEVYERWGFKTIELQLGASVAELGARLVPADGPTFGFVHVQTDDVEKVKRDAVKVLRLEPDVEVEGNWVRVRSDATDADPEKLKALAKELSYTIAGVVVSLGVQRGAFVRYDLFERGSDIDEYQSVPEYYGPLPPGDAYSLGANATVVGRLTGADPHRVREVARTAASPGDLPPTQELYEQIAAVMGLQP